MLFATILIGLISVAPVPAVAAQDDAVVIRNDRTMLFDDDLAAKFAAGKDYILSIAEWDEGEIEIYGDYLRVTGDGEDTLWIRCADVIASACESSEEFVDRRNDAQRIGGLPLCPTDPRCPKPKGKVDD